MPEAHHDVLVLGGGSGLTATYHAESDGKDVAVVEPGPLGGTCINRGCIPTKTLIQSADVMRTIQGAGDFDVHLDPDTVDVDFPGIMQRMRSMRKTNVQHSDDWLENSEAITLYREKATFVDDRTVELSESGETISAEHVFVTTGASPLVPPIEGIEDVDYQTNRTILNEMNEQPDELVILGGGYIGLEFAHFFASLGTDVTILEMLDTLAAPEDADVREVLNEKVAEYATVHLETKATAVTETNGRVTVTGETKSGDTVETTADELLVAAGRTPDTRELNLEATGVETTERGWIDADAGFQTSNPNVYAYGDVVGRGMFKHTSSFEGEVAYRNSQGADREMSYDANPHAIFTEPKVAGVGVTEDDLDDDANAFVETASYMATAKGAIVQADDGFAKAIVDADTREILGFHVVGPEAPALVHEVVVAMTAGEGTVDNVTDAIHVHPTLSELVHTLFSQV